MALTIKQSFIIEDINDENGNKLGEIKFNPNDARIMSKLTKIVSDLNKNLKELENIGQISNEQLEKVEDFEKISNTFELIEKGFGIEEEATDNVLNNLSEVFGKETIDIFTGGTKDILSVMPLIEYILPYVKKARESRVNKYINKSQTGVME